MRILARTGIAACLAVLLGGAAWLSREIRIPAGPVAGTVLFEIEKGWSVRTTASALKERGLIRKTTPFVLLYGLFHRPKSLKAGEYELSNGISAREVLDVLLEGKIHLYSLTVPEGLSGPETFEIVVAAGFGTPEAFAAAFLDVSPIALLDPEAADLEGYLFPETYHLPKNADAADVVFRMTGQFLQVFGADERLRAAGRGMSPRDAVILASLIEKETSGESEKPLVAAVFHNRLRLGMRLECDPTIIYAMKRQGVYRGRLLSRDLKFDSPYNTYLHPGLPPGPICNPGRASIAAALRPADVDYLYFVADRNGGHVFSRTFREHLEAVRRYRQGG